MNILDNIARKNVPRKPPLVGPKKVSFIDKYILSKINSIIQTSTIESEIEASLGRFRGSSFNPGITKASFYNIYRYLKEHKETFNFLPSLETSEIRAGPFRRIEYKDGRMIYQEKVRESINDFPEWNYRIRVSKETTIKSPSENLKFKFLNISNGKISKGQSISVKKNGFLEIPILRTKLRYSFVGLKNIFSGLRIDLTRVIEDNMINSHPKYEVEIEIIGETERGFAPPSTSQQSVTANNFLETIKFIKIISQGFSVEYFIKKDEIFSEKRNKLKSEIVEAIKARDKNLELEKMNEMYQLDNLYSIFETDIFLVPESENFAVSREYNSLFRRDISRMQSGALIKPGYFFNYRNKPKAIYPRILLNGDRYAITIKYDGLRKFLLFSKFGVYLIEPTYTVHKIDNPVQELVGTLLDGEWMVGDEDRKPVFYAFDILFFKGKDVKHYNKLESRLELLFSKIGNKIGRYYDLLLKSFYISGDPSIKLMGIIPSNINYVDGNYYDTIKVVGSAEIEDRGKGLQIDGIIYQPRFNSYKNDDTWKWKPPELLTIDFYLEAVKDGRKDVFNLLVKPQSNKYEVFTGDDNHPYSGEVTIKDANLDEVNGQIIEMRWDFSENNFVPVRFRGDRVSPNFKEWAVGLWKNIHDPIVKDTILGKDLRVARAFLNDEKSRLIEKYTVKSSRNLDVGSGRGGDILKWKKRNLTVFAVDPNSENMKIMKERQSEIGYFNIIYINSSATDIQEIIDTLKANSTGNKWKVESITVFFCMHFFSSAEDLDRIIFLMKEALYPGGYIIGIVLDGERVKKTMGYSLDLVYDGWSIKKVKRNRQWNRKISQNEIIVNVDDPSSMVKEQREYLFGFNDFEELMNENNFLNVETYNYHIGKNQNFSESARLWLELHRLFVFQRLGDTRRVYGQLFPIKEMKADVFDSPYGSLYRFKTILDSSNIIHAILRAFNKKYLKMNSIKEKEKYVSEIRSGLANDLTYDIYSRLAYGLIDELSTKKYREYGVTTQDSSVIGWAFYTKSIADYNELLGSEIQEYISDKLNLDIYILSENSRDIEPSLIECNLLYKHRPSIIILKISGVFYETVGKLDENGRIQTVFDPKDELIKQLYTKACSV